tara:strand:- start:328 stop:1770 length:1443 start_codon:yes stop_codon:yes gene_type:complete
MKFRFPWVRSNQRIVPTDFRRLAASVEDLIGNMAEHMFEDDGAASSGGYGSQGIVLWGLSVSDATAGGVAKVSVSPGAALLPPSAGERSWRLAYLSSSQTVSLVAAQLNSPRTDTIQLGLISEPAADASVGGGLEESENRDFRSLNAQNQEQIASQATPTYRAPAGEVSVNQGSSDAAAGAVRLANVTVTLAAVSANLDKKQPAFPSPVGSTMIRGFGTAYRAIRDRVAAISTQVDSVISVNGGMLSSASAASGGPSFGPADYTPILNGASQDIFRFNERHVFANHPLRGGGFRPIPTWLETVDGAPHAIQASHYENDADGLRVNAAVAIRAIALVRPYQANNAYTHAEWVGQNVSSVNRTGAGFYNVTFNSAGFGSQYGDWWSDRFIVRVYSAQMHYDTPLMLGPGGGSASIVFRHSRDLVATGNVFKVNISIEAHAAAAITSVDAPFAVELIGPIGASQYDANAHGPGAQTASWNAVG